MAEPVYIYGSTGITETSQFERLGYVGDYNKVITLSGVNDYYATGSNYGARAFVVKNNTGVFVYPAAGGGPLSGSLFDTTNNFVINTIGLSRVNITNASGIVYLLY